MIRKLMCWLGWHEYRPVEDNELCGYYNYYYNCGNCDLCKRVCKHCGKIKK